MARQRPDRDAPVPYRIVMHVDGDGTIYEDLAGYRGLEFPLPDLGFEPSLTYADMDALWQAVQTEEDNSGRDWDGVSVVNGLLVKMVHDGRLKGLNNEVLRHIGRDYVRPYPGVLDTFERAKKLVEELSGGQIELEIVINSCNLREFLVGSVLGDAMRDGLITDMTGQIFREHKVVREVDGRHVHVDEIDYVTRNYLGESKIERMSKDIRKGRVDPSSVIAIGDGSTDRPMFEFNAANGGTNFLLHSADPRRADKVRQFFNYAQDNPGLLTMVANDWSEHGQLNLFLASVLQNKTSELMAQLRHAQRHAQMPSRLGGYHTKGSDELASALGRVRDRMIDERTRNLRQPVAPLPRTEQTVQVRGGSSKSLEYPVVTELVKAAAAAKVKAYIDADSAKPFFLADEQSRPLTLVVESSEEATARVAAMFELLGGQQRDIEEFRFSSGSAKTEIRLNGDILKVRRTNNSAAFKNAFAAAEQEKVPAYVLGDYVLPVDASFARSLPAPGRSPSESGIERPL